MIGSVIYRQNFKAERDRINLFEHGSRPESAMPFPEHVEDLLKANELIRDPRILHLSFSEISADPVAMVRRIYEHHGLEVSAEFQSRVEAWLADPENAVDRCGRYPYSYEAFGLDREWVQELFADYSRYFGLE